MRLLVGGMIGVGLGLVAGGLAAIVSPFREELTHFGTVCLGIGLLAYLKGQPDTRHIPVYVVGEPDQFSLRRVGHAASQG